jgi:hypothetical protein
VSGFLLVVTRKHTGFRAAIAASAADDIAYPLLVGVGTDSHAIDLAVVTTVFTDFFAFCFFHRGPSLKK